MHFPPWVPQWKCALPSEYLLEIDNTIFMELGGFSCCIYRYSIPLTIYCILHDAQKKPTLYFFRSDSVKGGFNKSRRFVIDVSEELQIGPNKHRVAMIVYSGNSYRREIFRWNFAKSNEEFVRITNGLRAIGGTTNTEIVS